MKTEQLANGWFFNLAIVLQCLESRFGLNDINWKTKMKCEQKPTKLIEIRINAMCVNVC